MSRTIGGKWLLHSKGKLVKPYDYVPSDFATLLIDVPKNVSGSDKDDRGSQPYHSS